MRKFYLIIFIQSVLLYANSQAEVVINEVMSSNKGYVYDIEGDSSDWIELYNPGGKVTLKGYTLTINDKSYKLDDIEMEKESYHLIWCSGKEYLSDTFYIGLETHIQGKLSKEGVTITLLNSKEELVDTIVVPELKKNQSYGKIGILTYPTPGTLNPEDVLISKNRPDEPIFSVSGGLYKEDFTLELSSDNPETQIYYTLDGSEPTLYSNRYSEPITIKDRSLERDVLSTIDGTSENFRYPLTKSFKGTVVRAISYLDGHKPSKTVSHSYFITEEGADRYTMPVVSISTDKENLFDYERGIYMLGVINDRWKEKNPGAKIQGDNPANYNQRGKGWTIPVNMEFFGLEGVREISTLSTMRVMGGWTRENPVKSFRLDFDKDIPNKIFPEINREELDSVIIRTSANDWNFSLFRDALMTSLVDDLVETQEFRPVILFLNGEYWGIHNIRERFTEEYIADHKGLDKKDIVILENDSVFAEGNKNLEHNYQEILDYIEEFGLKDEKHYNYIKEYIDIENFIDYVAIQIYYGNCDWPGNNVRYWQDVTNQSKWRWLLYDTDFGFGLYDWAGGIYNNTIELIMNPNGRPWPNPSWSTFLFRSLMENSEFKQLYLERFDELLKTRFSEANLITEIDKFIELYKPEITEHINRWDIMDGYKDGWLRNVVRLKDFARERGEFIKKESDERLQ